MLPQARPLPLKKWEKYKAERVGRCQAIREACAEGESFTRDACVNNTNKPGTNRIPPPLCVCIESLAYPNTIII